jgi:rod shape-determining protein MreD
VTPFLRSAALVAFGLSLLVAQSALGTLIALHPLSPNLLLPIVIYLGVSPDVSMVRGSAVSFVLGYLLDLFCGNLMSLSTFIMVATFMLARGAGLRLMLRGPAFQVLLTFVVGMLASGAVLALRAIFEAPAPFEAGTAWDTLRSLLGPALVTALFAPLVFPAARRVDSFTVRRREEPSGVREVPP